MDIDYNLRRTRKLREELRLKAEEAQKAREADRLSKSLDKHFRTTFIGALSAFEKEFGDDWGVGIREEELTDEEYSRRKRWEAVRTTILNNGNNERRAAQAELREYSVEWDRHHVDLDFNQGEPR